MKKEGLALGLHRDILTNFYTTIMVAFDDAIGRL